MYAWALIDQLVCQGVDTFCIAPGSRSTPLVCAAAEHKKAKTFVHFDERGLGFYALGLAKGLATPVALIVTSGTAVANLLPAVWEAFHSEIPLLLLTADRPHELRECGANQTTNQVPLCPHLRWHRDLCSHLDEKTVRSLAVQGYLFATQFPKGPVQLNCPFQEPFSSSPRKEGIPLPLHFPEHHLPPLHLPYHRGILWVGEGADPQPIVRWAEKVGWPLFSDLLAHTKPLASSHEIHTYSHLLEEPHLVPDCIVHFGRPLTEKKLLSWHPTVPRWHVSPSPHLQDPERLLTHRVVATDASFCQSASPLPSSPSWLSSWQEKERETQLLLQKWQREDPFTEAHLYSKLPNRPTFLGNGLPIRHANFLGSMRSLVFANRGLSGIDGNIATLRGLYDALQTPMIGVIGDQAALFDLNSLSLLKNKEILLIIVNNGGGKIFETLPIRLSSLAATYFINEHSWNFQKGAEMFSLPYWQGTKPLEKWPLSGVFELSVQTSAS